MPKWSKLPIQDLRHFVVRLNNEQNELRFIEVILEENAEFEVQLNAVTPKPNARTTFHWACYNSQSELVDILLQKSGNLKIDLNTRDMHEDTA